MHVGPVPTILCGRPPDLCPFELKIGTLVNAVTPAQGNVHAKFRFAAPFRFRIRKRRGTDRRTDGQDALCGHRKSTQQRSKHVTAPQSTTYRTTVINRSETDHDVTSHVDGVACGTVGGNYVPTTRESSAATDRQTDHTRSTIHETTGGGGVVLPTVWRPGAPPAERASEGAVLIRAATGRQQPSSLALAGID